MPQAMEENSSKTIPNGATASIDRMVINESGNVGIGTAMPAHKLEIRQGKIAGSIDNDWQIFLSKTFSNIVQHHATFIGVRGRGMTILDIPHWVTLLLDL